MQKSIAGGITTWTHRRGIRVCRRRVRGGSVSMVACHNRAQRRTAPHHCRQPQRHVVAMSAWQREHKRPPLNPLPDALPSRRTMVSVPRHKPAVAQAPLLTHTFQVLPARQRRRCAADDNTVDDIDAAWDGGGERGCSAASGPSRQCHDGSEPTPRHTAGSPAHTLTGAGSPPPQRVRTGGVGKPAAGAGAVAHHDGVQCGISHIGVHQARWKTLNRHRGSLPRAHGLAACAALHYVLIASEPCFPAQIRAQLRHA